MDPIALTGDPIFWGYTALLLIIGIVIGWLFTRRGWRKRAAEAESRVSDLQAMQRRMERDMQAQPDDVAELQQQVDEAARRIQELEASLEAAEQELATYRGTAAAEHVDDGQDAAERVGEDEAEESVDQLTPEEIVQGASGKVDQTTGDGAAALTEHVEAENEPSVETEELRMRLSLLQEEYDAAMQNAQAELVRVREQVDTLEAARDELRSELDSMQEKGASSEDMQHSKLELEHAQARVDSLEATRIALQTELAALREKIEDDKQEIEALNAKWKEAGEGCEKKEIALNEAYVQIVSTQQQLDACKEQYSSAQNELEAAQAEVEELIAVREKLEKRVSQSRAEVAVDLAALTAAQLQIKDDALAEAHQKINALTQELKSLRG